MTDAVSTPPPGRLLLVRHGQTEWSRTGQHTGLTDLSLVPDCEDEVRASRRLLEEFDVRHVVVSPLQRARRTAELLGCTDVEIDPELVEWDYGAYEGLTTPQIRERTGRPGWTVWRDGVEPGQTPGENLLDVAARAQHVIDRALPRLTDGDVLLVGHGQMLRILASVWLGQAPQFGAQLPLLAGGLSVLGHEREERAIVRWNEASPGRWDDSR